MVKVLILTYAAIASALIPGMLGILGISEHQAAYGLEQKTAIALIVAAAISFAVGMYAIYLQSIVDIQAKQEPQ